MYYFQSFNNQTNTAYCIHAILKIERLTSLRPKFYKTSTSSNPFQLNSTLSNKIITHIHYFLFFFLLPLLLLLIQLSAKVRRQERIQERYRRSRGKIILTKREELSRESRSRHNGGSEKFVPGLILWRTEVADRSSFLPSLLGLEAFDQDPLLEIRKVFDTFTEHTATRDRVDTDSSRP